MLPFYYAAPRRNVPQRRRCQCSATSADWRERCDAEGVVSYYDFGVRLGGAPAAAMAVELRGTLRPSQLAAVTRL